MRGAVAEGERKKTRGPVYEALWGIETNTISLGHWRSRRQEGRSTDETDYFRLPTMRPECIGRQLHFYE